MSTDLDRPLFTGFAPSFAPAELPAPHTEITTMSIISENADRIIQLITDNGGSMSGEKLREELADMEAVDRRKAIGKLREDGRITSTGATTRVTYYLPDQKRKANGTAASEPARDQFDVAEEMASQTLAARGNDGLEKPAVVVDGIDLDRRWTVCVPVPIVNGAPEVQLLGALDFIAEHFGAQGLDAAAVGRAATWLASKYQVAA